MKILAFLFSSILTFNSLFINNVLDNAFDSYNNFNDWAMNQIENINDVVLDSIDYFIYGNRHNKEYTSITNNNTVVTPTANYYNDITNSNTSNYVHNYNTYSNTINQYYSGDTNYHNYSIDNNYYNASYYTENNNTYYCYEDTYNYYTSYYNYTNYTVIEIPKTNPNQIATYQYYYQTPSGQNSYNLTPYDVYGVYLNGTIYNYDSQIDGNIIALFSLDGNKVNSVPNSNISLVYDGQTYVNSKFSKGLQLNGTTQLTLNGVNSNQYSLRFWYYNSEPKLTAFPLNAWACVDYTYDNGNVRVWVNGIEKTYSFSNFDRGVFLNRSPINSAVNVSYSSVLPANTLVPHYYSNYTSYDITINEWTSTATPNKSFSVNPITISYVNFPSFGNSVSFNGTDNPNSTGKNYINGLTVDARRGSKLSTRYFYGTSSVTPPTLANPTRGTSSSSIPSASQFGNGGWYSTVVNYSYRDGYEPTYSNITAKYWTLENSIIDDIAIYDGILWTSNHVESIPTDPQEVGFIWSAPTGDFNVGDIAIKSDINVTGYRVGGAQPTPPYNGLLYISLDNNYYATDCKIYNGSTWVHIDFGVYNGTSWISGYNYNFKNGFAVAPSNIGDKPSSDISGNNVNNTISIGDDTFSALSIVGQVIQWFGILIMAFPLIPLPIRIFIGGIVSLLGVLITYKFIRK